MCDCFHIAFPNWHAASSGPGAGRRLRGPEPGTEDNSICDEASQFTEGERPRPQGSSPVEEFPESDKYDSDKECEAEHDPYRKSGKKTKKSGLGSIFDKRSTPKMSKLKEAPSSPEAGVIVKTAKDGGAEGLVYSGGGKDGIFIKEVVPESPASKNLHLKEGDQVLSATVYFDNIPYEDAIQILEHAQAYKVKLCLKRKPEITETEGVIDSDAIPEDEVHQPEMRDPGKKRRGDARISWPKFPSLSRGKKSRFTRSHSSSEADEQRKLELSPTTSDTESPIKTQDALKGKKKHKIKLPGLKRGRISSSEDTDAQNIQTEEMISPECLESPSRETQDAEEQVKKGDDAKVEESETETHKTELVCLDTTLKTADITEVLVEQETPSATASPDGKKKKKERSELKMKILGKDKKHKAKSSPKRLKTLGASLDKTDDKENEKTEAVPSGPPENIMDAEVPKMSSSKSSQMELRIPKVEIDISDVGILCKSTEKKGKGIEEKQTKTGFKLPKVGLTDVATEEIIKIHTSVEGSKTKDKDDAYDSLSKGTKLPKREDIEIPGMEDASKITKDFKEPRAPLATISDADLQAETVQMSIDVDSVKEAVSKLPGYKLPKVDMSGVPIPDEITVIDANAQRISVKTPTKGKHESKSVFTEMSIKLPNVKADVSGGELTSHTKVGLKKLELDSQDVISTKAIISQTIEVEKVQKEHITFSCESEEKSKDLDIKIKTPKVTMPDLSISKPDIKVPDFKMDLTKKKDDKIQVERTIFLPGDKMDVKVPDVKTSPIKAEFEIPSKDIDVKLKLDSEEIVTSVKGEVKVGIVETKMPEKQGKGGKFKMPTVGISMPKAKEGKAPEVDVGGSVHVSVPEVEVNKTKSEFKSPQTETDKEAKFGIKLKSPEVSLPKKDIEVTQPEGKIELDVPKLADIEITGDVEGQGGKFKLPKIGLKMPQMKAPEMDVSASHDVDVTLPDVKVKVELPEVPAADVTVGTMEVSIPKQKVEVKAPSIEADIEGGKFRMPKVGVKMPKGPEIDISLSKKDKEVALPKVDEPKIDVSSPEKKIEIKTESEVDGRGGKFKMPKLGITMPKIKGPEIDLNLSKKDVETTLPDVKTDIKVPDLKLKDSSAKAGISTPVIGDVKLKTDMEIDYDPSLSVKMTTGEADGKAGKFKMPKLGISMPKVKGPEIDLNLSKDEKDMKPTDIKAEVKVPKVDITVGKVDVPKPKIEMEKTNVEIKPIEAKLDIKKPEVKSIAENAEIEGQSGKYKIPRFTISIPKVKGPEIDLGLQKKEMDVALPEAKIEVEVPKVPKVDVEVKSPEMDVDIEGQGGKFKRPKFGIKMPKVKGPEIDLSLQKKDMDIALPEAKIEVEQPKVPKVDVEVKSPEMDVDIEGQGGKFKRPKFGIKMPKVKGPEIDISLPKKEGKSLEMKADVKVPEVPKVDVNLGGKVDVKIPETKIEVEKPSVPDVEVKPPSGKIKIKAPDIDVSVTEDSPSKFKMPSLGISVPKIKAPEVNLSKQDIDVTMPEANVEVVLPEISGKVDVKAPEVEVSTKGSPLKFKMPTFKLPKFGGSIEEKDSEIKIEGGDQTVSIPQANIDLPDVSAEVTLPETEVKAPSGEVVIEQPRLEMDAKFKKPRFSLPRFSFSKQSVPAPEVDISAPEMDVPQPEGKVEVKGEIDVKSPELDVQIEGHGGKFKLPKFGISMPKISAPEIDLSLSKKDVEVTLPEAKVEGKLPDVEVKAPSIEAEIRAPEIEVETKTKEGSPSKLKMPTFKFPKFGGSIPEADVTISGPQLDVELPDVKAEIPVPEVEVKAPSVELEIEQPQGLEMDAKFKKPRFSLPRFSFSKQSVPAPEVDISAPEVDIPQPEGKVKVKEEIDVKSPELDVQIEGQGSKFKLPKFGISMPKMTAPEIDLSLSKKDAEVTLPEAKFEGHLSGIEVKAPSIEAEIKAPEIKVESKTKEGSPSKLKMPTFKLPKFGASIPEAEIKVDGTNISKIDVDQPEVTAKIDLPEADIKAPSVEVDGQGGKFKLPKFGISMPKISAPEIDLSLSKKDVEVTLPEAKVEGKLPDIEVKAPSIDAEIKAPEIKVETKTKEGSPSKLKMPTFKFPKFGGSIPEADVTVSGPQLDVELPDVKAEIPVPEVEVKAPSVEVEIEQPQGFEMDTKFKKPRFSLPRFSFSKQSVPAPEVDISAPEVDIPQPEGKVEVKGEIDVKSPELDVQIEGQGSKFKLPKFGISMPKMTAPEIDLSLSKKDVEVILPEAKVEGKLPDVDVKAPSIEAEIKAPEIKVETKTKEGSPSKLKMPTFKLPKFGASIPEAEIKVDGTNISKIDVDQPEVRAKIDLPEVDVKAPSVEVDRQGGKFKLPKFGISMPKMSAPETDLSLSKKDVDVALPEAKVEGKLPGIEVKTPSIDAEIKAPEIKVEAKTKEGSPSKLKMPTFKLPKFGASIPEAEIKVDGTDVGQVHVDVPEVKAEVHLPEVEVKAPSVEVDGQGGKFKLPKFGISMPKISAPEIDLSLSKKDVEVTLPEAKVEGKLPDVEVKAPSIEAEIRAPEIKVETKTKEGSPSKLKMPTFKFPKFGGSIPEADVTISGPQLDVELPDVKAEIPVPEVEVKAPSVELEIEQPQGLEMDAKFKKPRFSLPRFSFSKQSVPAPEVDISAPDVDIPQPEGNVEVKGEIDVKSPELDVQIEGQGSKFKLPKFGISMPKMTTPEIDLSLSKKDVEVTLPEAKVKATVPDVEVKAPSIEVEGNASEIKVETKTKEGSPSKLKMPTFKLPKFGVSIPEAEIHVDGPDVDTKVPQVDSDLPDVKVEVQLPEAEIKAPSGEVVIEQPPGLEIDAKFKKPRFSLPRFSFSKQSVPAPEVDIGAPEVDISQPEGKVEVKGEIDVKSPELDVQIQGQGSKFKLPKFGISMPKMTTPEIDLSLSKKDVEVTLPEAKLEAKIPDVEVKAPSIEAEIRAPQIKVETKTKEGSPSKLKMPTFKFPKFGASIPEAEIKVDGTDVAADIPDVKVEIDLPETEVKVPSGEVVIEQPSGLEMDGKFKKSKFSLPRFSFPKQSVPAPEVDISAPEINVPVEENVEVKAEINVKSHEFESQVDGQRSKFKFPKFGISMPKMSAPEIDLSLSKKDVEVTLPETKVEGKPTGVELKGTSIEAEIKGPEIKVESKHIDDSPSKLKMPSFRMPKFGLSSSVSADGADIKTDIPEEVLIVETDSSSVDIKMSEPEMKRSKFKLPSLAFSTYGTDASLEKRDMQLPEVEIKDSPAKVDIKVSGMEGSSAESSPSKFKMPTFKLPKFGATAQIDGEVPDVDRGIKVDVNVSKNDVEGEKSEAKEESKASWSLPKISFSKPIVAASEIEASVPESKKEVQTPDGKKSFTVAVEGEPTSEIDVKIKKPRFSLPKLSFAKQSSIESEADANLPEVSSPVATVEVKHTAMDQKTEGEVDAQGSKFKMPKFGISMPKVKGPEIDVSISKKEAKADVPENKASLKVEESPTKFKMPALKLPKIGLSVEASDADKDKPDVETTVKTTPDSAEGKEVKKEHTGSKFSFGISMPKVKGPEIDFSLSKKDTEITSPDATVETTLPEAEDISLDAKQKGASWSFPKFSFSKPAVNATDEADVDVKSNLNKEAAPELEAKGTSVAAEDSPAAEPEMKAKFSLPKFSFSKSSSKEPIVPENAVALEVSLAEGEVKIKEPKDMTVEVNTDDTKSKETGGSPLRFKMPVFKMPKIGITTTVSEESSSASKDTEETIKITKESGTVVITAASPSIEVKMEDLEIKTDVTTASTPDPETPQAETQGSPSKFKLPSFKMPRLGFSKAVYEDENTPTDSKIDEGDLESKSPKKSLPSLGEILKNIDVEFDVPSPENLESPNKNQEAQKEQETIKKETKQEATKSPERTGWFKFPTFGLSSPTERVKEDKKSPADLTGDEEISPTCSIQSSEAFGDISSTITSENIGFSLSSPTKVTVKYSDPDSTALMGESHSNVVMSMTKTQVISVEPNLPEKVMILSSGRSSSSEDTVKLESGKIHIISSNIQATPDSQQAKMLTSIHVQSAEGVSGLKSWTVKDSQSSQSTFMESRVVKESSSKEVVITKQITRMVKTTEPISDETATSIKQLKDSVHTDKMRFFDEAEQ